MGYGIYEDGFIQFINPDEYEFVFDYIDKLLELLSYLVLRL